MTYQTRPRRATAGRDSVAPLSTLDPARVTAALGGTWDIDHGEASCPVRGRHARCAALYVWREDGTTVLQCGTGRGCDDAALIAEVCRRLGLASDGGAP